MGSSRQPIAAILVAALTVAGCAVELATAREGKTECNMARVGGIVVVDPAVGVGFRIQTGETRAVVWPFGWTARQALGGVVIFDEAGGIVAHEGDRIAMAGGVGDDGVVHACGHPELVE